LHWKLHWALRPNKLFVVRSWWDGMTLVLPHSGSAAAAFYTTFPSEAIALWMSQVLRPGMTVVDVGAHVGVYSLLAARLVGPRGLVHAIEPQQECVSLIERNAALNQISQLKAYTLALAEENGPVELLVDRRRLSGFVALGRGAGGSVVAAVTLDSFIRDEQVGPIDVLKLDAAGNEVAVLMGARSILEDGTIANVICKLYNPNLISERLGTVGNPIATVNLLRDHGFRVELPDGRPADEEALDRLFTAGHYSVAALARRRTGART
jgi:FkbM family methyltransferase